jgi:hypothetical protein
MATGFTTTPQQQELMKKIYEMYERGDIYAPNNNDLKKKEEKKEKKEEYTKPK